MPAPTRPSARPTSRPTPSSSGLLGGVRPTRALRLAGLGLIRRPGTAVPAVLTLALGLTVAVTLLGIGHGMTRRLPVPEGEEVVRVELRDARGGPAAPTAEVLEAWRGAGPAVEGVEAFRVGPVDLGGDGGRAVRRSAAALTAGAFELLGVDALAGRLPGRSPDDGAAVVLGEALAELRFGSAGAAVGATLRLDGRPHSVVGVMPASFGFPYSESLWTVLDPDAPDALAGSELFGRLADGASEEGARAALEGRLLPLAGPDMEGVPTRAVVRPFVGGRGESDELMALAGLGVLVGVLLLVAAANVSTLLQVRATERAGALAVHAALGAPRLQVALQLLLEAAWIALSGGVLGVLGGYAMLRWIEATLSVHWGYHWMRMEVDPRVLTWTAGVVAVVALVAGTAPAVRAMRTDLRGVLAGSRAGRHGDASSLGRWLVGGQVALSTAGLVAAAFLGLGVLRSAGVADRLPLEEVSLTRIPLDAVAADAEAWNGLVRSIRESVGGVPGVEAVSVSGAIPGFGALRTQVSGPDLLADAPGDVAWEPVDEGFFAVYGLDLLRGRGFDVSDDVGAPVVVVNRTFAERFLPAGDPLDARLRLAGVYDGAEVAVVGVVTDPFDDRAETTRPYVFVPFARASRASVLLSLRGGGDGTLASAVAEAVASVDPDLPVDGLESLRAFRDYLTRMPRAIGSFGALGGFGAVVVAAVGLYGVLAFRIRRRRPELGIRMALGASRSRVLGETMRRGLRVMLPGLAVGLALGIVATTVLASFLFGPRTSVGVYVGVALIMLTIGAMSSLGPALQAAHSDPREVLRSE